MGHLPAVFLYSPVLDASMRGSASKLSRTISDLDTLSPILRKKLAIRLRLQIEQFCIATIQGEELGVCAALFHNTLLDDKDAIGQAHRAETMTDKDGGFPFGEQAEPGEDFVLGLGIERASWFVENENRRIPHKGASQRHF